MIEGISNNEIVGDWQHFLTLESSYIFQLPEDKQRLFARNFSIGNKDAENSLMELWKYKIETRGTDIIRPYSEDSINNITLRCNAKDIQCLTETIRKIYTF